jgi:hypothetical protein
VIMEGGIDSGFHHVKSTGTVKKIGGENREEREREGGRGE